MSGPVQLSFNLRTSSNVRTVHLLGSWDNYKSQLPLSAVKDAGAKPGSCKGSFRFQGSHSLKLGSRYWYYYILDGYHVSHDPAKDFVTEKTTGRKLNVLDVPAGRAAAAADARATRPTVNTQNLGRTGRAPREVPKGRALSPGKIVHPKPSKPYASRGLREADYDVSPVDELEDRFAATRIADDGARGGSSSSSRYPSSPSSASDLSDDSSGTVFSRASPSSLSSLSDVSCKCDRYGVTRSGQRIRLDCGGKRCGYSGASSSSSSSSDCSSSSSSDDSDSDGDRRQRGRKEVVVRHRAEAAKGSAAKAAPSSRRTVQVVERRARR